MATEQIHPEILFFAPSEERRTAIAEYAQSYADCLATFKENLTILPVLSQEVPEELDTPDVVPSLTGRVRHMTREVLNQAGATANQVLHLELDSHTRREFCAGYHAARLRPDSPLCIVFHEPPILPVLPRNKELNTKSSFLERFLTVFTDGMAARAHQRMVDYLLSRASVLLSSSKRGGALLAQKYPRYQRKIAYLPPVSIGKIPPQMEPNVREFPAVLELTFFGFIRPNKGIEQILEALFVLQKKNRVPLQKHFHLRIRGYLSSEGLLSGYAEGIKKMIYRLELNNIIDFQPGDLTSEDADQLLTETDVLLLPYRPGTCDGASMALLRAEAWCVAPIASDTGSMHELIENGSNGLLYTAGNMQSLVDCLQKLIQDKTLCQKLAQACRDRALTERAPVRIASLANALYREMLTARDERRAVFIPEELRVPGLHYETRKTAAPKQK
ncbi:TPA: hypothetical protein DDW35_08630 [Candidatus Sumerlaeota bacterium]|jgi:glycosyltransferase involved in cell wall biosynthesis|nr:hypothetical protein [Candidatus Sumerlaeota bacterium]